MMFLYIVEDDDDLLEDNISSDKSSDSEDNNDDRSKDNTTSPHDNDSDDIMVKIYNFFYSILLNELIIMSLCLYKHFVVLAVDAIHARKAKQTSG